VKPNTLLNYKYTERLSAAFMGDRFIDEITPADADGFRVYMKEKSFSEGNIRRRCKQVRQFFNAAVRSKLIAENPFLGLKCGDYADVGRWYFVTAEQAQAVIAACPDAEWRLIFALCRFAGLRCPSEVMALRWGDVDWEHDRFTVHASKTEHHDGGGVRVVPIFPELAPYLREVFDQAEPGTLHVITRYRGGSGNLRTGLNRIIARAGLKPWPKLFNNLRSTCETELCQRFPIHYVTTWLGNSLRVAGKHYLQVPEDAYRHAASGGAKSGAFPVQNPVQQGAAQNSVSSQAERKDDETPSNSGTSAMPCEPVPIGAAAADEGEYARQELNL